MRVPAISLGAAAAVANAVVNATDERIRGHLIPQTPPVCGSGNESIPRISRRRLSEFPARTRESPQDHGRKAPL
jgi:hypothetical protein